MSAAVGLVFGEQAGSLDAAFGRRVARTVIETCKNSLGGTLGLIGVAAAPHVVALGGDAANDGFRADGGWQRHFHAEQKFLSQYPALRARPLGIFAPVLLRDTANSCSSPHWNKKTFQASTDIGVPSCRGHNLSGDAARELQAGTRQAPEIAGSAPSRMPRAIWHTSVVPGFGQNGE